MASDERTEYLLRGHRALFNQNPSKKALMDHIKLLVTELEQYKTAPQPDTVEPIGEIDEDDEGKSVELYPGQSFSLGQKVYLHPPAQTDKLPAGWCSMGVGDGSGNLFVHGAHAAIKACQKRLLEIEKLSKPNTVAVDERANFEKRFAMPEGVFWNAEVEQYDGLAGVADDAAESYHAQWMAWHVRSSWSGSQSILGATVLEQMSLGMASRLGIPFEDRETYCKGWNDCARALLNQEK